MPLQVVDLRIVSRCHFPNRCPVFAAVAALASVLPPGFNPTYIYEYRTVRPDELMVQFDRYDDVFRDSNEDEKAYSHLARQVLLFQKGMFVDGVAISTVFYKLPSGHGRLHTMLSEGLHEVQFFTNPDVKPLAMVDPVKQIFDPTKSYTSLSIGPKFSFSAARYKRPDRRESQPEYQSLDKTPAPILDQFGPSSSTRVSLFDVTTGQMSVCFRCP